ncbi:MAG: glycerate kinase [Nitratireductor sp.]|nr:glycerate kinase [Nitratireductor sp.]
MRPAPRRHSRYLTEEEAVDDPRGFLVSLFNSAVDAADPLRALSGRLPARPAGRTVVVGAGKGVAQLAAAFEKLWEGPVSGLVVTRYGYACPTRSIEALEASHPVPDEAGIVASTRMLEAVQGLTSDDLVVALVCGGGSALLPLPPTGFTLEDEKLLNKALLDSGAPITVMNAIRKRFSRIKGGRLAAAAHPARLCTLVVSDIPGDDPAQVASGPTVGDHVATASVLAAIRHYGLSLPQAMLDHIASDAATPPLPDDPLFVGHETRVVASAAVSLEAARARARANGFEAHILSDAIEGEAREVAKMHAAMALQVSQKNQPFRKPALILSGGETTVTIRGNGKGGRNSEFLLSFAIGIEGTDGIHAMAADTDGIDGSQDNAGAFCDGSSTARMRARGGDPLGLLANNDAWSAFNLTGELFVPGPTGTNVNDFRAILVL